VTEKISSHNENDYSPVNQYIDDQSRLRRAKSFRINAKSWALLLLSIGLLAVLLAWAYSLLDKHYILKRVTVIQEEVIKDRVNAAITGGNFTKTNKNLSNLNDNIKIIEENEKIEKALSNEKDINKTLLEKTSDLSSEIDNLKVKIESEKFIQTELKKDLEDSFGEKISELKSENLDLLNQTIDLKQELKSNPDNSELIKKIDELEKQGQGMGNLRYFSHKNLQLKGYNLAIKTRFHFEDVRKKPNKIECYINFGTPVLADLELGSEKSEFKLDNAYIKKGFNTKDFLNIKKNNCSWNYFN